MNKFGQKRNKENVMEIIECVKAGQDLTVGKRYLKLSADQTGANILTRNDEDLQAIVSMEHFKVVESV